MGIPQFQPFTTFGGCALLYICAAWVLQVCFFVRKSHKKSHVKERQALHSPLLPNGGVDHNTEEGSVSYRLKPVKGLWKRQIFAFLEVLVHGVTALYIIIWKGGETAIEGTWVESSVAHFLWSLAWSVSIAWEQANHRDPRRLRPPWGLAGFALVGLAGSALSVVQMVEEEGQGMADLVREVATWNVVIVALYAVLLGYACARKEVPRIYHQPLTPEQQANLASYATFWWFNPVIRTGLAKRLDASDLPQLIEEDTSMGVWAQARPLFQPFQRRISNLLVSRRTAASSSVEGDVRNTNSTEPTTNVTNDDKDLSTSLLGSVTGNEKKKEVKRSGWRLAWILVRLGGMDLVLCALFQLIGSLSVFGAPLALRYIVKFITNYQPHQDIPPHILVSAAVLFLGPALQAVADGQNFFLGRRLIVRYKAALLNLIFRKALKLDMSCSNYSVGELTNLCSVDADSVEVVGYIHFLWSTALQILVCVGLIFWVLGVSALAGLGFMIISLPITAYASKRIQRYQTLMMEKKDARMSLISEVLHGIRIIKMFAWEKDFLRRIERAREEEVSKLRRFIYSRAVVIITWDATPCLVAACTFLVHTLVLKKPLSADMGYAALALFDLLRFPLVVLPDMINYVVKSLVSFGRIETFLEREEVGDDLDTLGVLDDDHQLGVQDDGSMSSSSGNLTGCSLPLGSILIQGGTFRWGSGDETPVHRPPTLENINLNVTPGQLVLVCGPLGGGKSSLLMAMIREIRCLEGSVKTVGKVSYVAQKAFIRHATIKDNILFGKSYDPQRYAAVVEACALTRDLQILEAGDMTEIGEKGINLSGGQQQRISLARAVYNDADIVILDDVLSAVDAHVAEHIFNKCILGTLQGKTRVLVTHQIAMTLPAADYIVIMGRDGRIVEQGSKEELSGKTGGRLADLLKKYDVEDEEEGQDEEAVQAGREESPAFSDEIQQQEAPASSEESKHQRKEMDGGAEGAKARGVKELIKEEERAEGSIKLATFWAYVIAMGGVLVFVCGLAQYGGVEGLRYMQNRALGEWVNGITASGNTLDAALDFIYISAAATGLILIRALAQSLASLKASLTIHHQMAQRVLRGPCSWYECTPIGRVLNRFSSDIETLDKNLMDSLGSFIECVLQSGAVVGVIILHLWPLIIGMVPMLLACWFISRCYLKTSRELKRLESNCRSPIYSHFSETVIGVSTVRAYGQQQAFIQEANSRVDAFDRVNFYLWTGNRWLAVRLQLLGATVTGLVGCFLLASLGRPSHFSSTTAGLVLLYSLTFSQAINWLIRNQAELEMNLNSVERTTEYISIAQEAPAIVEDYRAPMDWPDRGEITVEGLELRYASSTRPVISAMSFHIPPRTKVGVVGRTGAGKSSLLTALYRLVEPAAGSLVIDGIDIRRLGLEDLRSRLAIVPQDPQLFRGNIRTNMDPFNEYTDKEVWAALHRAHLGSRVESLCKAVTENGGNMSVGERQLLCMARALLRKRAVLVMDEATANVDLETDALIQALIREEFSDCTVVTVAHRLLTVAYYDRVMVLDQGHLVEYGSPLSLLSQPDSMFYSMCSKTGDLNQLIETAREAEAKNSRLSGGGMA